MTLATRRRGVNRVLLAHRCLRLLTFDPCGRLGRGSAHVCAALCRSVDLVVYITTYVLVVKCELGLMGRWPRRPGHTPLAALAPLSSHERGGSGLASLR